MARRAVYQVVIYFLCSVILFAALAHALHARVSHRLVLGFELILIIANVFNAWMSIAHARATENAAKLNLRTADLLAIVAPSCMALFYSANADRIPDAGMGALALCGIALFAFGARAWAEASKHWFPRFAGDFYVFLTIGGMYRALNPIIDLVSPQLLDAQLIAVDQRLFGVQASVALERIATPWLTEVLFIAYALFFVWQFSLAGILHLRKNRDFERFMQVLLIFYLLTDTSYTLVPAIGPRFALEHLYQVPLDGVLIGSYIRDAFKDIPMKRDCFPSGHTGVTLLVLITAWRLQARRFFFIMLPFAVLLIFSTVYCRFHYLIDLVCALPMLGAVLLIDSRIDSWRGRK